MYILGIHIGHDSSACLIKDGIPLSMVEEERFIRIKHANKLDPFYRFPANSIQYCLSNAGITMQQVDAVAIPINVDFYPYQSMRNLIRIHRLSGTSITPKLLMNMYLKERRFSKAPLTKFIQRCFMNRLNEKVPTLHFVDHHKSHAASSFYSSGFKQSAILTVDGVGDGVCIALWKGTDQGLEKINTTYHPNSLGKFYESFVGFIGLERGEGSYKMMGLAPYGEHNEEIWNKINPLIKIKNGLPEVAGKLRYGGRYGSQNMIESEQLKELEAPETTTAMVSLFGKPNNNPQTPSKYYKDIAFAAQEKLELILIQIIRELMNETDSDYVCSAGGVALNCKANGRIRRDIPEIKDMFIQPASNDGGLSLGAGLEISFQLDTRPNFTQTHCHYGPEYSDEEIEKVLKQSGFQYQHADNSDGIADLVADLLSKDKIVGWFQGRMEWGPRALGARSILANPGNFENFKKVNKSVKHREMWRPLSPSCLDRYTNEYFENGGWDNPFMLVADQVKPGKSNEISAVVHVDNSARPQSVKKETNYVYYKMIEQFESKTGIPIVMNTSFNDAGDPVVCKPEHAISTFSFTAMDAVAIGNFLIEKKI